MIFDKFQQKEIFLQGVAESPTFPGKSYYIITKEGEIVRISKDLYEKFRFIVYKKEDDAYVPCSRGDITDKILKERLDKALK